MKQPAPISYYLPFPQGWLLNPFTPKRDLIDFTLPNARRFYSSKGDCLVVKGLIGVLLCVK